MDKEKYDWIFHDIAHCANSKCERRHNCQRWLAHLDAVDKNMIVTYCSFDAENCDSYMEFSKDNMKKQMSAWDQICTVYGIKD